MVPTLESLGIEKLSVEECLVLVQRIWDSIADSHQPPSRRIVSWERSRHVSLFSLSTL